MTAKMDLTCNLYCLSVARFARSACTYGRIESWIETFILSQIN